MIAVRIFNRSYKSVKEACDVLEIPRPKLDEFIDIYGREGEELDKMVQACIKKQYQRKGDVRANRKRKTNSIPVSLKGKDYPSVSEAALDIGVPRTSLENAVRRHGGRGEGLEQWLSTYKYKPRDCGNSITILGVPHKSLVAARKAIGCSDTTFKNALANFGGEGVALDAWAMTFRPGQNRRSVKVIILGDTFRTMNEACKVIGISRDTLHRLVREHGTSGDQLDRAVEAAIEACSSIKWGGREYKSLGELEEDLDNPFITIDGLRSARSSGELDHYLKTKTKKAARHTVNGTIFKSVVALIHEFGLKENAAREIYANGGNFEDIVTHLRPDIEIEKRVREPGGNAGKAVTMSGWTWSSRRAFFHYYGLVRKAGVNFDDPRGVAVQAEQMLIGLYQRRALLPNNRLRPDLEAKLPGWCLPLDQPRGEPLNRWDMLLTPDWHHLAGTGTKHAFHAVHDLSNFEKMVLEKVEAEFPSA
jgi:hypothetical protein